MTPLRFLALVSIAGLALALVACGGSGGSKKNATRTPSKRTPAAVRTVAPTKTLAPGETAGAPTASGGTNGGGDNGSAGSSQGAPSITGPSTNYRVSIKVASDPSNLQPLVEGRSSGGGHLPTRVTVVMGDGGQVMLNIARPLIRVTGTIDGSGNATAKGTGSVGDYDNVEFTFTGTITPQEINGNYAVGTNGALPGGQAITYSLTGTATSPATAAQQQ